MAHNSFRMRHCEIEQRMRRVLYRDQIWSIMHRVTRMRGGKEGPGKWTYHLITLSTDEIRRTLFLSPRQRLRTMFCEGYWAGLIYISPRRTETFYEVGQGTYLASEPPFPEAHLVVQTRGRHDVGRSKGQRGNRANDTHWRSWKSNECMEG